MSNLSRRAALIESLFRDGIQSIAELATSCDEPPEEITADLAALVEPGAVRLCTGGTYDLSDSALAAMDAGIRTAAECVADGATHPCIASANALVVLGHTGWQLRQAIVEVQRFAQSWLDATARHPAVLEAMRAAYDEEERRKGRGQEPEDEPPPTVRTDPSPTDSESGPGLLERQGSRSGLSRACPQCTGAREPHADAGYSIAPDRVVRARHSA